MRITKDDIKAMYDRQNGILDNKKKPKKNKHNAKKVTINGIVFASGREGNRYLELKLQEKAGFISELELQPKFILQYSFKRDGKTISAIKYTADFRYYKDGVDIVEESKGHKTEAYSIRKRLFLKRYPKIKFIET